MVKINVFDVVFPDINLPDINYSYIQHNFIQWSIQGYWNVLGFFFLPIFYLGIIGFVYAKIKSATAATVAILIIVSAMGNAFSDVPIVINVLQILVSLIMSILVVVLLTRVRS